MKEEATMWVLGGLRRARKRAVEGKMRIFDGEGGGCFSGHTEKEGRVDCCRKLISCDSLERQIDAPSRNSSECE